LSGALLGVLDDFESDVSLGLPEGFAVGVLIDYQ
jgi:hypothetical protein